MSDKHHKLPLVPGQRATEPAASGGEELERLLGPESAGVIAALLKQVREHPGDEIAWLKLGGAYMSIEHWAQAVEALQEAIGIDETMVEARRMLARVLSKQRHYDQAVYQLVQARRTCPEDAEVARELGAAFYDKGLFDKALSELERAQSLASDDGRVSYAIGLVHEAKNATAQAIVSYREAVRLQPEFIEARMTLADALASVGELAGAVTQFEAVLRKQRTNTQAALNLEALQSALAELKRRRLLGKTEKELAESALLETSGLVHEPHDDEDGRSATLFYRSALAELRVSLDGDKRIADLALLFPDPERAATASGEALQVTVVSEQGQPMPANYATAVSLTFLREAVGCPMTRASEIYAQLLQTNESVVWAGAKVGFRSTQIDGEQRHGLFVDKDRVSEDG